MRRKLMIFGLSLVALLLWCMYLSRVDGFHSKQWGSRYRDREAWAFCFNHGGLGIWYNNPNPLHLNRRRDYHFRGFNLTIHENFRGYRYYYARIPLWAPALLASIYPTVAFIRGPLRRWHRRQQGCCQSCGYDLTGNISGRCPECGTAI